MKLKPNISIRKILQVCLTIVVSAGCIIAMVSAERIEDNKMLAGVEVHFKNDKKYHFIEENEIMNMAINNRNIDVLHTPVSGLDIHTMEQVIMADPWVAHAQVYIDNNRILHMYVTQRIPVARIFQQDGSSYYLDRTLSIMPLSRNYIYYTTVVTNVPPLENDSTGWALRHDIVALVNNIQADTFWNAQISQVVVDTAGTFELMPVLGDHTILFGDVSGMKDKFSNLFLFYKNVLNRIGWDKYQTLDLRFKGQVVASPSLPYKGPVDKAIDKMNWINSIVETEAKNDEQDSAHHAAVKPAHLPIAQAAPKQVVKPVIKPVAKPAPKPATKTPAKKAAVKPAKQTAKDKAKKDKAKKDAHKPQPKKKTTNNKEKDKKTATPKYVYPENKGH